MHPLAAVSRHREEPNKIACRPIHRAAHVVPVRTGTQGTQMTIQATAHRRISLSAMLLGLALLAGCASVASPDPRDPWESYNRSMSKFNDTVDDALIKPVATVYKEVLPQPVRTGVGNFFGNLGDAWSFVNQVLQAKPEGALHSFWRVVINTTMGLGGVLDPASEMRLQRQREDLRVGQPLVHAAASARGRTAVCGAAGGARGLGVGVHTDSPVFCNSLLWLYRVVALVCTIHGPLVPGRAPHVWM